MCSDDLVAALDRSEDLVAVYVRSEDLLIAVEGRSENLFEHRRRAF